MSDETLLPSAREDFLHNTVYAYFRWKRLAWITFFALLVTILFIGYLITPTWEAEMYVVAEPTTPPPTSGYADPTRSKSQQKNAVYAQYVKQVLQGKELAYAVVKKFGLDERLRKKIEEPQNLRDRVQSSTYYTIKAVSRTIQSIFTKVEDKPTDWVDDAAKSFREGLFSTITAEVVEETDVIDLTLAGETPELANSMATFAVEMLRKQLGNVTSDGAKHTLAALRAELEAVTKQEQESERVWHAFLESNKGVDPSVFAKLKTDDLAQLYGERSRLLAEKTELERQRNEVPALAPPSQRATTVSDRILADSVVQQLRTALHTQRTALAARLQEVTGEHPDVVSARAQIQQTEAELAAEIEGMLRGVGSELRSKEAEIAAVEAELVQNSRKEFEGSRLKMDVDAYRDLRNALQNHVAQVAGTVESSVPSLTVKVLDSAMVSQVANPDSKMWIIVIIVAFVFSTGVAAVLPPFIEYWRDPIRGQNDLKTKGLIPLAVVPRLSRKDMQSVHGGTASRPSRCVPVAVSAWHAVAARLAMRVQQGGSPACFLVTSLSQDEGKTTTCREVAAQLAEMGKKAVVVQIGPDGAGTPSLAKITAPVAYEPNGGLPYVLRSLPESFASLPVFSEQPRQWVTGFDIMLIDAPVIGSFLQQHLMPLTDGVILVVDTRKRRLDHVVRSKKVIINEGGSLVGVVMSHHQSPLPCWLDLWGDRP